MRAIPGYPGYYVNAHGQIVSRRSGIYHLLKAWADKDGYLQVSLRLAGKKNPKRVAVHRLVALAFHGEPKPWQQVRHLDGTRQNNVPSNIAWGTVKENATDAIIHGHRPRGESSPCSKLTDAEVLTIRVKYALGCSQTELSELFNIGQSQISRIVRFENRAVLK